MVHEDTVLKRQNERKDKKFQGGWKEGVEAQKNDHLDREERGESQVDKATGLRQKSPGIAPPSS